VTFQLSEIARRQLETVRAAERSKNDAEPSLLMLAALARARGESEAAHGSTSAGRRSHPAPSNHDVEQGGAGPAGFHSLLGFGRHLQSLVGDGTGRVQQQMLDQLRALNRDGIKIKNPPPGATFQ